MAFSWGSSFLRLCRVANEQPRVKNENERTPCVLDTVLLICIFAVNFYLKKLDHYIKQKLGADDYMRYVDDMVVLGKSKKKLHKMRRQIDEYLQNELHLKLKCDWQVFRFEHVAKDGTVCGRMLDFMGFQFHYDRITMRKSTIQRARAKAYKIKSKDKITWYDATVMLSYMGWFTHTDTYDYYLKYIKPNVNVKKLKKIVSKHQRKENERERLENSNGNAAGTSGGGRPGILTDNSISEEEHHAGGGGDGIGRNGDIVAV